MEDLKQFYKKHSSIIIPGLFLLCSIFLILEVVVPSFGSINNTRSALSEEQKKLDSYVASANALQSMDEVALTSNVNRATAALPSTKDIQSIYLALTSSASSAGVSFSGFSISVGNVFGKEAVNVSPSSTITGSPNIIVNVNLSGVTIQNLILFMKNLQASSPLSEVTGLEVTDGQGTIHLAFFYKPYDLSVINSNVVLPLSNSQQQLLNTLPQK